MIMASCQGHTVSKIPGDDAVLKASSIHISHKVEWKRWVSKSYRKTLRTLHTTTNDWGGWGGHAALLLELSRV